MIRVCVKIVARASIWRRLVMMTNPIASCVVQASSQMPRELTTRQYVRSVLQALSRMRKDRGHALLARSLQTRRGAATLRLAACASLGIPCWPHSSFNEYQTTHAALRTMACVTRHDMADAQTLRSAAQGQMRRTARNARCHARHVLQALTRMRRDWRHALLVR